MLQTSAENPGGPSHRQVLLVEVLHSGMEWTKMQHNEVETGSQGVIATEEESKNTPGKTDCAWPRKYKAPVWRLRNSALGAPERNNDTAITCRKPRRRIDFGGHAHIMMMEKRAIFALVSICAAYSQDAPCFLPPLLCQEPGQGGDDIHMHREGDEQFFENDGWDTSHGGIAPREAMRPKTACCRKPVNHPKVPHGRKGGEELQLRSVCWRQMMRGE